MMTLEKLETRRAVAERKLVQALARQQRAEARLRTRQKRASATRHYRLGLVLEGFVFDEPALLARSPGQSGAPLFSEVPTCGKCVWGVYNQYPSSCEIGSKCNIAYPNVMGRMTSEWGAVLATIKASNPD